VTAADLLAEHAIIERVRVSFPDHNVISEESPADDRQSEWTWVIDPIDGTLNYANGLGHWCVSIGVLRRGEPAVGVIFDPIRDELFVAAPGHGARLNGEPIHAARKPDLRHAVVGFDLGYHQDMRIRLAAAASSVLPNVAALRLLGSAALSLCYVAAGRLDAYFHLSLYQWDLAAALSLLREAGAVTTTWDGRPATPTGRQIAAAAPGIQLQFRELLQSSLTVAESRP
jgi:myo-inositol-1(or 4)-monophosphatase